MRKYYSITESGQQALAEVRPKIVELVEEVLEGHGPRRLPEPADDDQKADEENS